MSTSLAPIQLPQLRKEDIDNGDFTHFNAALTQIGQRINQLAGHGGPLQVSSGIDLAGSNISNSGEPKSPTDLVTHRFAESRYSASAIAPQLEAGGGSALKSVRRLNDRNQRETNSSFLNNLMNTAPTSNDSTVAFGPVVSGGTTITVSGGKHNFVDDESSVSFSSRYDTVSLPATTAISTVKRANSIVTLTTSAPHGKVPSQSIAVEGVVPDTTSPNAVFDGSYVILATPSTTTLTYRQVAADATGSGGTISAAGVYMYYLRQGANTLSVAGPFTDDTQKNRLSVNVDGQVLIAVAVVTAQGGDPSQSSGGATPPTQTDGNRILNRL